MNYLSLQFYVDLKQEEQEHWILLAHDTGGAEGAISLPNGK